MQWQVWLVGCAVVGAAAALRRLIGFGFAMVSVSSLSLMIGSSDAVLVTLILQLALGLKNARFMIGATRWRILPWLIFAGAASTPIGILVTHEVDERTLRVLIGACILLALGPLLSKRSVAFESSPTTSAASGLLAGLLNSIAAMPAPPLLFYLMGMRDIDLDQRRATLITIFTLLTIVTLVSRGISRTLDLQAVTLALLLCPAALMGDYIGRSIPGAFNRYLIDGISIAIVITTSLTLILSTLVSSL